MFLLTRSSWVAVVAVWCVDTVSWAVMWTGMGASVEESERTMGGALVSLPVDAVTVLMSLPIARDEKVLETEMLPDVPLVA